MFNFNDRFPCYGHLGHPGLKKKKNSNNAESFEEHFYQCIKLSVLKVGNNVKGIIQ